MFGPLSIFGKDVFERDGFDLLARDDGQEPSFRAMVETTRISLFLVRNRDKMNKRCEDRTIDRTEGGHEIPLLGEDGTLSLPHLFRNDDLWSQRLGM